MVTRAADRGLGYLLPAIPSAKEGSRHGTYMSEPLLIQYGGYELTCHARAVDGRRFVPTLLVSKQIWPTRPRTIDVGSGDYKTRETAIEAAHEKGVEWVKNYG